MPHNNSNALTERPDVLTRPKLEGGRRFVLSTPFQPAGDQPTAIAELVAAAENLEFEEAARLRDEVKRLEAVELTIADDPLARQQAVEEAAEAAVAASGRSTAGRAGQRGGNTRSKRRG